MKIGEIERARNILGDSRATANGYLALGDTDNTFKEIQAAIEDRSILFIDSFPTAEWWNPIRDDPRFDDMLELLDSKVTHTQTYLNSNRGGK